LKDLIVLEPGGKKNIHKKKFFFRVDYLSLKLFFSTKCSILLLHSSQRSWVFSCESAFSAINFPVNGRLLDWAI